MVDQTTIVRLQPVIAANVGTPTCPKPGTALSPGEADTLQLGPGSVDDSDAHQHELLGDWTVLRLRLHFRGQKCPCYSSLNYLGDLRQAVRSARLLTQRSKGRQKGSRAPGRNQVRAESRAA